MAPDEKTPPNLVAVARTSRAEYPAAPFEPEASYPELAASDLVGHEVEPGNSLYGEVRALFRHLRLDEHNYGTARWNPLSAFVRPGQNTVIKPNLVVDHHRQGLAGFLGMVTHAAVIRPLVDYVLLATGGKGRITICDVPLQKADWGRIIERNGLADLVEYYRRRGIHVELLDCRREIALVNWQGVVVARRKGAGDPRGYAEVDLGAKSALEPILSHAHRLEITDYGYGTVPAHHEPGKNEYYISRTMLEADFFLNVPKMKTHRKAGVTLALKNLVGINGDKSWIAHHRRGRPAEGGDEFPEIPIPYLLGVRLHAFLKTRGRLAVGLASLGLALKRALSRRRRHPHGHHATPRVITEGSWYGNDTLWRTILDLNAILCYADAEGRIQDQPQRKCLAVCDGVIGCDGEGPMDGVPVPAGVLAASTNPVALDLVVAHLMGFDWRRIPQINNAFESAPLPLTGFMPDDVLVSGDYTTESWRQANMHFRPASGWRGHIER